MPSPAILLECQELAVKGFLIKNTKINKSFNASLCLKLNQTIRSYDISTKAIFNSSIDKIWEELQLNKGPLALQAIAQTFSSQL